ncbi:MAG: hypothetical protein P9L92_09330 [Candidatus Electryonea clarkiae]|nr:hypothetical protein [Candidatus Electryonea clarkiae]MDP8288138.1 hypothetical protein [Candidatus Electryonea clarkiae]
MKYIILVALLISAASMAFCQIDEAEEELAEYYMGGDREVGGFLHIKYQSGDIYNDVDGSGKLTVDDILDLGYFPIDKLSIGAMVKLGIWKTGLESSINTAIGPRIDYYIPYRIGSGYPYLHVGSLFATYEATDSKETHYEFGLGYSVPVNEYVSIVSLLYYSMDEIELVEATIVENGSRIGLRFGIKSYHF